MYLIGSECVRVVSGLFIDVHCDMCAIIVVWLWIVCEVNMVVVING